MPSGPDSKKVKLESISHAIDVLRQSFVELGILDTVPEAKILYTDQFVPVKF